LDAEEGPIDVTALSDSLRRRRPTKGTSIVGITGSVASGKSTLARNLADDLRAGADRPSVEIIGTDGFLFPNAVLAERGLDAKKGFPESYDLEGLSRTLLSLRRGPTLVPAYSHTTYDVDPDAARALTPPDILIVEGLGLGLDRTEDLEESPILDTLVYIDAEEADLEAWYVARFLNYWDAAATDPGSFYARFRHLDRDGAAGLARAVWASINLPNLRAHIAPVRPFADIVARKSADHAIAEIIQQSRRASTD
jgi:type I pantothenate kinase